MIGEFKEKMKDPQTSCIHEQITNISFKMVDKEFYRAVA